MVKDITTIKIKKETHTVLCALGHKGETFDDLIRRLIEIYKRVSDDKNNNAG